MIIKVGRRVLDHVILRLPIESHPCGLETNTIVTIYDVVYRAITTTTTSLFFSYEQLSFTRTFHTSDSEIVFIFEISQISGGLIFLSEIAIGRLVQVRCGLLRRLTQIKLWGITLSCSHYLIIQTTHSR